MSRWKSICAEIAAATGVAFEAENERSLGGGSINDAWLLASADRQYFVKTNRPDLLEMFIAEAEGLQEMAACRAIKVPAVVCYGTGDGASFLVLEYFGSGHGNHAEFGTQLAVMHRHTKERFGWHRDNTIGSTPQPNAWSDDWVGFLREQRLGYQVDLASRRGAGRQFQQQAQQLLPELEYFFEDYQPQASLLHGDLWSGNYSFDEQGNPVIFDPAVYYGDREADIAMTELFGGFSGDFYTSYQQEWPLDQGYSTRKTLYNLYHIINHFNLFGGGYESQATSLMERLNQLLP